MEKAGSWYPSLIEKIGVDPKNKYIFARREGFKHYRSTEVMYKMTRKAGLKHPEYLTARNLRTHVCTMARLLDLGLSHGLRASILCLSEQRYIAL